MGEVAGLSGPTKPPVQLVLRVLPVGKVAGAVLITLPPLLVPRLRNGLELYLCLHSVPLQTCYGVTFTFIPAKFLWQYSMLSEDTINRQANITPVFKFSSHICNHGRRSATIAVFILPARSGKMESNGGI